MTDKEIGDYWRNVHRASNDDLAAVCHPGEACLSNRFLDHIQKRAIRRVFDDEFASIADRRLLDIGCGRGRWLEYFRSTYHLDCTGVDLSDDAVAVCKSKGLEARVGSAVQLPFPDESFDIVTSITVLMHLPNAQKRTAFSEVSRVLRPRGTAVLLEGTNAKDPSHHVFSCDLDDWEQMARDAGLALKQVDAHHFTLFRRLLPARLWLHDRISVVLDYPLESLLMRIHHRRASIAALQHLMVFTR